MPKNKTIYEDIPEWGNPDEMEEVTLDFLPKPEELIFRPKLKKITIVLDEDSIKFFKKEAKHLNTSYQRMIRTLLHEYVKRVRTHSS